MHGTHTVEKWTVCIDMASKRDNAGKVAHGFSRGLFSPIRHGGAYQDVFLACPSEKGDLKRCQQCAEERGTSNAGQFPHGVGKIGRNMRNKSMRCTGRGLGSLQRVPEPAASGKIGFPESSTPLQFRLLPERAFSRTPSGVGKREWRKPLVQAHKILHISHTQILDEHTEGPAVSNGMMNRQD